MLWAWPSLYTQVSGITLAVGMPEIEPGLAVSKASALPTVLSLQLQQSQIHTEHRFTPKAYAVI